MYKFYLQPGDLNEATSFYVEIIKKALVINGEKVEVVSSLNQIKSSDKVFTIQAKAFFSVWLRNPKQYIMIWFQGVVPEEAMCQFEKSSSRYVRKFLWECLERLALKYGKKIFFVSKTMLEHYKKKYGYMGENYFIMPCFNQVLDLSCFSGEKYSSPSFVYAGSLSRWQCIDETLSLYKKIKDIFPQATLTLLTKERETARKMCEKYEVTADVEFIPSSELQKKLKEYKYGFIVRDDIIVNNVATPTKMNSYMAAGVIPVYSDVIGDFKFLFSNMLYAIPFHSIQECLDRIINIEEEGVCLDKIKQEYIDIFSDYYSVNKYIELLRAEFQMAKYND